MANGIDSSGPPSSLPVYIFCNKYFDNKLFAFHQSNDCYNEHGELYFFHFISLSELLYYVIYSI